MNFISKVGFIPENGAIPYIYFLKKLCNIFIEATTVSQCIACKLSDFSPFRLSSNIFSTKGRSYLSKQIIYLLSVGGIVPLYHLLAQAEFASMSHLQ